MQDINTQSLLIKFHQFISKQEKVLQHICWLILTFFAVKYSTERMMFQDTAFYLFNIIHKEGFTVEHFRHVAAFFTQIIPVILVKVHAPIRWVMIGYSLNFILFYYAVYQLVIKISKDNFTGWWVLICCGGMAPISFFWPVSELQNGMALLIFLVVWLIHAKNQSPLIYYGVCVLISIFAAFFHPFILMLHLIVIVSLMAFREVEWKKTLPILGVALLVTLIEYYKLKQNGMVSANSVSATLAGLRSNDALQFVEKQLPSALYRTQIQLLAVIFALALWKNQLIRIFLLTGVVAAVLFLTMTYMPSYAAPFYREIYSTSSLFFIILPLFCFAQFAEYKPFAQYIFFALFLSTLIAIPKQDWYFSRITKIAESLQNLKKQDGQRRFLMNRTTSYKYNIADLSWASAEETMLLSSLMGFPMTITITSDEEFPAEEQYIQSQSDTLFLGIFANKHRNIATINQHYFPLPEKQEYRVLK